MTQRIPDPNFYQIIEWKNCLYDGLELGSSTNSETKYSRENRYPSKTTKLDICREINARGLQGAILWRWPSCDHHP